jgi:hypothetical protein
VCRVANGGLPWGGFLAERVTPSMTWMFPFLSLLVNVADLAALAGGSLSTVFAVGYGVSGRGVGLWGPDAAIALGLVLLNVGLRGWRRHRKLREWRRYPPDGSMPSTRQS